MNLTESNEGATKEGEEPLHGGFGGSSGHSIWFQWEASATELVTVGTCGSDFATALGVYTGSSLNTLTKIGGSSYGNGPNCPGAAGEVTFEATNGGVYEIAVDGDPFYLPPASPPPGVGTISLHIAATPSPPNDDFADATPITGSIAEEEGAEYAFYWKSVLGFNWNATKEIGEPEHAGDPGGASIWYRWVAPASGTTRLWVDSCFQLESLIGVYTGAAVDALTPVPTSDEGYKCSALNFTAEEGTTYRIALDGKYDAGSGKAKMANQLLSIQMLQLPIRPRSQPAPQGPTLTPQGDITPPDTTIQRQVLKRRPPIWSFHFESTESGSTFRCKLDKRPFAKCGPTRSFAHLSPGRHMLKAFAVDSAGNADPTPAVAHFGTGRRAHAKR